MIPAKITLLTRYTLRIGMFAGIALLLAGAAGAMFTGVEDYTTIRDHLAALRALRPTGFLFAGLAVLTLTPLAGLVTTAIGSLLARQYRLAALAGVLLALVAGALALR